MSESSGLPSAENPWLAPWTGPCGGVPPFDRLDPAELEPALEAALAAHLAEVAAIADDPAPPTFANTIVALERAGAALERVTVCYGVCRSTRSSPALRALDARLAPRVAEHGARVLQDARLYARVRAVAEGASHKASPEAASHNASPEAAALSPAERRLVKLVHARFARHGATLTGAARERHAAIDGRLAELYATFRNHLLADEEQLLLLDEHQLGGLPASVRQAAAAAAAHRGHAGRYAILTTRSSVDPFLAYSTERGLREIVWRSFQGRGAHAGATDNRPVVVEILRLRAERARLSGSPDHAAWNLEDRMAGTPERARALLDAVWPAAVARVREEVAALQAIADRDAADAGAPPIAIAPWDYAFYADRLRKEAYALDSEEVRQYLQLDRLRDAMHHVAEAVFGLRFTALPAGAVPVIHPDVRVWEVTRRDGGALVGLWYLDPFARPGKRSGAWASAYRGRSSLDGEVLVLASNNANFLPAAPGEPVLVSWDDARVLFHEFGHALHVLASTVTYPTLGGCVRDYSELQSQLLEHWLPTERVIRGFLVHHATGEPMPAALVAKIAAASTFLQGFLTTEYLAAAFLDLELHRADPAAFDAAGLALAPFEHDLFTTLGLPVAVAPRHRPPHFSHLFSGDGYAAGYYGYLWADVLTADVAEAFATAPDGFYDAAMGERALTHLFAPRDAVDPAEAFRAFRGRDPEIGALMRDRGFV